MSIVGGIRGDASRLTFRRKFYQIGIIFGILGGGGWRTPSPLKKIQNPPMAFWIHQYTCFIIQKQVITRWDVAVLTRDTFILN